MYNGSYRYNDNFHNLELTILDQLLHIVKINEILNNTAKYIYEKMNKFNRWGYLIIDTTKLFLNNDKNIVDESKKFY